LIGDTRTCFGNALPDVIPGDAVHLDQIRLDRAIEDQRVPQFLDGIASRIAVLELEVAAGVVMLVTVGICNYLASSISFSTQVFSWIAGSGP
jgi:hypothetical protein